MARKLAVTIHNQSGDLTHLRRVVEVYLEQFSFPSKIEYAVNLVLEEVVVNIIHYAYDDEGSHEIAVSLQVGDGELLIEVEDDGREFNPLLVETPGRAVPEAERADSGLGLRFIRHVRNAMEYKREQGRNLLRIWIFE